VSPLYTRYKTFDVPDGYVTIPLCGNDADVQLRLAVLVRVEAEPVAGHLVVLRDMLDCRVLLGCILDASGRVLEWAELRVQRMAGLDGAAAVYREALSNSVLDERWKKGADALEASDAGGLIRTGWESVHPRPSFIDVDAGSLVHPQDASGAWCLCEDDELLRRNGLPPYSSSCHRYLTSATPADDAAFIPVTPGAPAGDRTVTWDQVLDRHADLVPFNPEGGLVMVRAHATMGLGEYLDVLAGKTWQGITHGKAALDLEGLADVLRSADDPGRLFLSKRGRGGRILESLHLRLRAFADVLADVRNVVSKQRYPLLNISDESFRVHFSGMGRGLPLLWSADVVLVDSGDAVPLRLGRSETVCYLRPETRLSVYRPASEGLPVRGEGSLRIRETSDTGGGAVVEGTFHAQEEVRVSSHDVVWLRVNLGGDAVDFYGRLEEDRALAAGEWRFRSLELAWSDDEMASIKAAEGVPLPNVPFEVLPLVSTPSDLYALAVIGVRLLLVDAGTTLPVALDETISIAREANAAGGDAADLPARLAELFSSDARWANSLGPQRLVAEELSPEEAFGSVPVSLWVKIIALLVRMLPGMGPFSTCADYGDARQGGLDLVFDQPLEDAQKLLLETRDLVVTDWAHNREMRELISERLAACDAGNAVPGDADG